MEKSLKEFLERSREIDRGLGRHAEKLSRIIWPAPEKWLIALVGLLALLDFTSTYLVLNMGNPNIYESGLFAAWALDSGGFFFLLLLDIAAAVVLSTLAFVARYVYRKRGLPDYGRAAFVFLLAPYVVITVVAVINNVIMFFL
jgi:hypothetical protein